MELEYYLTEEFPRQASKDFECKICNELVMRVSCEPGVYMTLLSRARDPRHLSDDIAHH